MPGPGLAYRYLNLNAIAAFWFAYVMTRPLGASFADWMGNSRHAGGLGWGDGYVALVLGLLIFALVGYEGNANRPPIRGGEAYPRPSRTRGPPREPR